MKRYTQKEIQEIKDSVRKGKVQSEFNKMYYKMMQYMTDAEWARSMYR